MSAAEVHSSHSRISEHSPPPFIRHLSGQNNGSQVVEYVNAEIIKICVRKHFDNKTSAQDVFLARKYLIKFMAFEILCLYEGNVKETVYSFKKWRNEPLAIVPKSLGGKFLSSQTFKEMKKVVFRWLRAKKYIYLYSQYKDLRQSLIQASNGVAEKILVVCLKNARRKCERELRPKEDKFQKINIGMVNNSSPSIPGLVKLYIEKKTVTEKKYDEDIIRAELYRKAGIVRGRGPCYDLNQDQIVSFCKERGINTWKQLPSKLKQRVRDLNCLLEVIEKVPLVKTIVDIVGVVHNSYYELSLANYLYECGLVHGEDILFNVRYNSIEDVYSGKYTLDILFIKKKIILEIFMFRINAKNSHMYINNKNSGYSKLIVSYLKTREKKENIIIPSMKSVEFMCLEVTDECHNCYGMKDFL